MGSQCPQLERRMKDYKFVIHGNEFPFDDVELAEVANVPTDPQCRSLVNESLDRLKENVEALCA